VDPSKVAGAGLKLLAKPLEGLVLLAMAYGAIAGVGVWASWWTAEEAMAFVRPILISVAIVLLQLMGPVADLTIAIALVYAIHSLKKGAEIATGAAIVALISWRFGGQDWIAQVPALVHHLGSH